MDIAIIGMAGIYPGAPNARKLWENILAKFDAVTDAPPSWNPARFVDPAADGTTNDKTYTGRGGFIDEFADFDPLEFGIMPGAVDGVDPEQFLSLRLAQEALVDAGYGEGGFDRSRAGVVIGHGNYPHRGLAASSSHTIAVPLLIETLREVLPGHSEVFWEALRRKMKDRLPPYSPDNCPGLVSNILSGRIANRLDLMGPNFLVDGACSSGVLALNAAANELTSGRSDLMLAGGVQANTSAGVFIMFSMLGALSRRGKLRPFDRNADGTLLGEGLGMLVLKRLEDARRDKDRVYAVVKGIGLASDGKAKAMLTPRLEGEVLALRRAYGACGIDPATISLLEAHGTGTTVGDRTEVSCMREIFGERGGRLPDIAVGSLKSMISHTIPASAIAGLMKVAMALHEKVLPPTLCDEVNPELGLEATRLCVNTEARPWVNGAAHPRRAGLNAFGFGGINSHVVLEEAEDLTWSDPARPSPRTEAGHELLLFTAADREGLVRAIGELRRELEAFDPLPPRVEIADHCRRRAGSGAGERLALVVGAEEDLGARLDEVVQRLRSREPAPPSKNLYVQDMPLGRAGKLAFLVPGEGSQYVGMVGELCLWFPELRRWFDLADRVFLEKGLSPKPGEVLFPPPNLSGADSIALEQALWSMDIAVASVVAANCALYDLFRLLGVRPDALVGHSTSQDLAMFAGMYASGPVEKVLPEFAHGLLSSRVAVPALENRVPRKCLVSVGAADAERLRELVDQSAGALVVAMDNCPNQVVLCGERVDVEAARAVLEEEGALCMELPFDRAYHTPWYLGICRELEATVPPYDDLAFAVPVYSTTTTEPLPGNGEARRRILIDQWSGPVRFRETVLRMHRDGVRIFLEVGPRGNLSAFVADTLAELPHRSLQADLPHRGGWEQLMHTLAALWSEGVDLDAELLFRRRAPRGFEALREEQARLARRRPMKLRYEIPLVQLLPEEVERLRAPAATEPAAPAAAAVPGNAEALMRTHFDLMSRFLEVQEQVMGSVGGQANPDTRGRGHA
jgi:acyl transferase domain-containing protein